MAATRKRMRSQIVIASSRQKNFPGNFAFQLTTRDYRSLRLRAEPAGYQVFSAAGDDELLSSRTEWWKGK
jgi:hypothetical protein